MKNNSETLLFFQHEIESLKQYILKLQEEYSQVMDEKRISTEQSSETWHDNFMFEESQRRLKLIQNQLDSTSDMIQRSRIIDVKNNLSEDVVKIGSLVTILDGDTERQYFIGGFITSQEHPNALYKDIKHISYKSAVAEAIIGKVKGDEILIKAGKSERTVKIIAII